VIANSDRDGVSGHFMVNLGRSDNIRLHNWGMSNSANWVQRGHGSWEGSSVGQARVGQDLWVSLSGSEGEER